jgi:fibronectin type 3 domain-containing protein
MKIRVLMIVMTAILVTSFSYAAEKGKISPSTAPGNIGTVSMIPPAPTNLVATADTAGHVKLTWSYSTADAKNIKSFMVERRPETGEDYAQIAILGTGGYNVFTDEDYLLKPGARYFYRMRAYNGSMYSGYSNEYPANIWSHAPSPPTMMTVEYANLFNGIKLRWQAATRQTKYILYRYETGKGKQNIAELPANSTEYIDKMNLKSEVQYIYTLTAYNNDGEASGQCTAMILSPPAAPSNFHATGPMTTSSTTLSLSWVDNANNEDGFWISRRPSYQGNYPTTPTIKLGPNVTKYNDTGLEPETTYYYIIAAVRAEYSSTPPVETSATTNPYLPENLQAISLSSSQVKLTWTNRSKTADLIMIERKTGSGNFEKIFQKQPVDLNTYTDKGLKPGTSYSYRLVVMKLPFNASDYTAAVSIVTPAGQ